MERKPEGMCQINNCHRAGRKQGFMKGFCCALCTIKQGDAHSDLCESVEEDVRGEGHIVKSNN